MSRTRTTTPRALSCWPAKPRDPETIVGPAMTTFIFEVRNIPAALYKAMGGFATNGINMTKLESYQNGASFAATTFFSDVVGKPGERPLDLALEELAFFANNLRILGTYPQTQRARIACDRGMARASITAVTAPAIPIPADPNAGAATWSAAWAKARAMGDIQFTPLKPVPPPPPAKSRRHHG